MRLVVLEHNGGADLLRCVGALLALEWPADRLEVVVVDNASTDGAVDELERSFPSVRVIRSEENLGFAGNNLAFDGLDEIDYVGLVNNDAFVEPGYLSPLVAALELDERVGAACPKILLHDRYVPLELEVPIGARLDDGDTIVGEGWTRPDDLVDGRPVATAARSTVLRPEGNASPPCLDGGDAVVRRTGAPVDVINNVGNVLTASWHGADRGLHHVDDGTFDEPVEVFAWSGGAVLLRAEYLREVGGFDPALFLYYEDLDLAWRGRSAGWRYVTAPAAVVRHRLGASTGVGSARFRYWTERNRLAVLAANAPARVAAGAAARFLLATASYARRDLLAPVMARRRPAPALVVVRLQAFAGFVRLLPHAVRRRRRWRRQVVTAGSSMPSASQSPTTGT